MLSSAEIEETAKKMSEKIENRLKQSVIVNSQQSEILSKYNLSYQNSMDSLGALFQRCENEIQSVGKSFILLNEKE